MDVATGKLCSFFGLAPSSVLGKCLNSLNAPCSATDVSCTFSQSKQPCKSGDLENSGSMPPQATDAQKFATSAATRFGLGTAVGESVIDAASGGGRSTTVLNRDDHGTLLHPVAGQVSTSFGRPENDYVVSRSELVQYLAIAGAVLVVFCLLAGLYTLRALKRAKLSDHNKLDEDEENHAGNVYYFHFRLMKGKKKIFLTKNFENRVFS